MNISILLRPNYSSIYFHHLESVSCPHYAVGDFASIVVITTTAGEYSSPKYLCLGSDGIAVSYVR